jgi:hypothetical protein
LSIGAGVARFSHNHNFSFKQAFSPYSLVFVP